MTRPLVALGAPVRSADDRTGKGGPTILPSLLLGVATGLLQAPYPKAACTLLTSRRYGRYLSADYLGRFAADGRRLMAARRRSVVSLA